MIKICRFHEDDALELYEFYVEGLLEFSKKNFAPYPLFQTPPESAQHLAYRIADWQREGDWTAVTLYKDNYIVGLGILKRMGSPDVTSGIAVRDDFHGEGYGYAIQSYINLTAKFNYVKALRVKIVSDNLASIRLHEKCGFKQVRVLDSDIYKDIFKYLSDTDRERGIAPKDRYLIEMEVKL